MKNFNTNPIKPKNKARQLKLDRLNDLMGDLAQLASRIRHNHLRMIAAVNEIVASVKDENSKRMIDRKLAAVRREADMLADLISYLNIGR